MTDHTQMTFRALADPTRRDILRLLSQQDMTIADVSTRFDMTRAAVKKHPKYSEHEYFIAVETAFQKWEAIQNVGR